MSGSPISSHAPTALVSIPLALGSANRCGIRFTASMALRQSILSPAQGDAANR
jgi:hypothetical protein